MPKTLLLADDSVTIRKVVSISFANEDVSLVTVDNGDDAVARAREIRPDLVLADVVMPGRNGYEVCETLKSDPALRHVPVLLLTGTFEAFDEERARRVGADGHVTKPFEAQSLVARVRELLAQPPATQAPAAEASAVSESPPEAATTFEFLEGELMDEPAGSAGAGSFGDEALTRFTEELGEAEVEAEADFLEDVDFETAAAELEDEASAALEVDDALAPAEEVSATSPPAPVPAADDEDFDFELEGAEAVAEAERANRSGADDAVGDQSPRESVLDPARRDDYDVSVRDLESPLEARTVLRPEAVEDEFAVVDEDEAFAFEEPLPELDAPPAPTAAWEAEPEPAAAQTAPEAAAAAPFETSPLGERAPERASASGATFPPALQQALHESLEKVAWEAFGDLAERIVPQVLERVEAVAWEVIPQMAEALIREEIRRMKGEE